MISIRDLTFSYPGSSEPALRGISVDVREGEALLVRGGSGCGKTSLLFCLNGIIPHVLPGMVTGRIEVAGVRPAEVPVGELARTVGTVFQNPDSQIFMLRVRDDVAFGCENIGLPTPETNRRVEAALRQMGLEAIQDRETAHLSGGEKQRLAIAGVRAVGAKILLFDEPMTDLDEEGRHSFIGMLRQLKREEHTLIIADHDGEGLEEIADRALFLDRPDPEPDLGGLPALAVGAPVRAELHGPAISLDGVSYETPGRAFRLRDLTLTVPGGQITAVAGGNGSGKTTLMKLILGLLKPHQGSVSLLGGAAPSPDNGPRRVGYLFQNPDEQLFASTVEEELMLAARRSQAEAAELLRYLGLDRCGGRHPHSLSRGERKKLAFAAVLMQDPDILLLDEPTTGLDEANWTKIMSLAAALSSRGKAVVFSSHNRKALGRYGRRTITLRNGRATTDG